jgi:hypothetical protein
MSRVHLLQAELAVRQRSGLLGALRLSDAPTARRGCVNRPRGSWRLSTEPGAGHSATSEQVSVLPSATPLVPPRDTRRRWRLSSCPQRPSPDGGPRRPHLRIQLSGVTPDTLKNGVHLLQLQMPRPRCNCPWWRRSELAGQPLRWQRSAILPFMQPITNAEDSALQTRISTGFGPNNQAPPSCRACSRQVVWNDLFARRRRSGPAAGRP